MFVCRFSPLDVMDMPVSWLEYWHRRAVIFYAARKRVLEAEHTREIESYTTRMKMIR